MSFGKDREYPLGTLEFQVRAPIRALDWRLLNEQQHYQFEKSRHKVTPLLWPNRFDMFQDPSYLNPPGTDFQSLENIWFNVNTNGANLNEVSLLIREHDLRSLDDLYRMRAAVKGYNAVVILGFFYNDTFEDEVSVFVPSTAGGDATIGGATFEIPQEWFDLDASGCVEIRIRAFVEDPNDENRESWFEWVSVYADELSIEEELVE